jgi:hypothetical protein
MSRIWRTIRSYIWWTHQRGSFHYDVMVSLILLFIFLAPRVIDFHDKPTERTPHHTAVMVRPDDTSDGGDKNFVYEIDASAVSASQDAEIRQELMRVVEPIAGEVILLHYEPVKDGKGRVTSYRAWVRR